MSLVTTLLTQVKFDPQSVAFANVIAAVDAHYDFTPTAFSNGDQVNAANENNGSCKVISFAQMNDLSPEQTLNLFGDYYRKDVLENPEGSDHQNIRQFMIHGWTGISFTGVALTPKA